MAWSAIIPSGICSSVEVVLEIQECGRVAGDLGSAHGRRAGNTVRDSTWTKLPYPRPI
eukprot:m.150825 g.150825  ORF g.150825 m.150825 type:complete len:58 (+) comp24482_c0_seq12:989-1162(+)